MTHNQIVLAMGFGYAVLGLVLLVILVFSRIDWRIKAGLIVLTSIFYIFDYQGARSLLGWASPEALPANFKLLGARIVEPHSLAGDQGAIFLWVEEVDRDNFPSGDPRLYPATLQCPTRRANGGGGESERERHAAGRAYG